MAAAAARPKKDKIWLWGLTVRDQPEHFYFRVLQHPVDAFDGRPRGTQEMIVNSRWAFAKE
jgi:hypothetical protein